MSLEIRKLEEEISMLKKDLKTAVAMIEMLSLAVVKYREFVFFNCACSNKNKQLLKAEDRFEQLAKACQFASKDNLQEEVAEDGEKSDGEWSVGNVCDNEDESSDENANTFQDNRAEEESICKNGPENNELPEETTRNEAKSGVDSTTRKLIPVSLYNDKQRVRIKWKQYKNDWHEEVETESGVKVKCLICQRLVVNFRQFKHHYQTRHHQTTRSYKGMCQELTDLSGKKRFQCVKCPSILGTFESARKHYKELHIAGPKVCPYKSCGKTFNYSKGLTIHLLKVHGKKMEKKKVVKEVGPFRCDWPACEYKTPVKGSLKVHRLLHEGEKKYKCEWPGCEFTAKLKGGIIEHAKRHGQQPTFACHWPGCSRMFYTECEVRRHVNRNHLGVKKYKCDWPNCDYKAISSFMIKCHMAKHTQERKWICSWPGCTKKYLSKSNLDTHQIVHKNIRPFKCQVEGCDKDFPYASTLKTHVRLVHEKIKLNK